MKFYDYNAQGFLVGWYEAPAPRPNSTTVEYSPIPPNRARWNGSAWTNDPAQEQAQAAAEAAERAKWQQAVGIAKAYNPATATAAEVRTALGATIYLLRQVIQELKD